MTAWDLAYLGVLMAFTIVTHWAVGNSRRRFWVMCAVGIVLVNVGYTAGRFAERRLVEQNTPVLLDRNMPR